MPIDRITLLRETDKRDANGDRPVFEIRFVTRDPSRRHKGSKHVHLKRVRRCGASHNLIAHDQIAVRPEDGGHPIPVHVALITHYNGEPVI